MSIHAVTSLVELPRPRRLKRHIDSFTWRALFPGCKIDPAVGVGVEPLNSPLWTKQRLPVTSDSFQTVGLPFANSLRSHRGAVVVVAFRPGFVWRSWCSDASRLASTMSRSWRNTSSDTIKGRVLCHVDHPSANFFFDMTVSCSEHWARSCCTIKLRVDVTSLPELFLLFHRWHVCK